MTVSVMKGLSFVMFQKIIAVAVSHLVCHDILLQNAIDLITKYDSYFLVKCGKSLLQNVSAFL